ncbi:hypothetical protein [Agaribacter flavus]|uniref:Secreted protein n=1 Tax=Agaribacter flavus TaxID=1902781 RepID=A0ABV7FRX2_9ALTE
MNVKFKLLVTTFVAAMTVTTTAHAGQSPIENALTGLVKSSLAEVNREMKISLQRDLLSASYSAMETKSTKLGKVTIKDITANVRKNKQNEDLNQNQNSDD